MCDCATLSALRLNPCTYSAQTCITRSSLGPDVICIPSARQVINLST